MFKKLKKYLHDLELLEKDRSYKNIYNIMISHKSETAAEYSDQKSNVIKITFSEYDKMIERASRILSGKIDKTGGFVGLKMKNSPFWPVMFWAILRTGFSPVLLDARAESFETEYLLKESLSLAVIAEDDFDYSVLKISPDELLNEVSVKECELKESEWGNSIALCTAGTTGKSRIFVYDGTAMCNQLSVVKHFSGGNSANFIYDSKDGECKSMAFLPLHHIFGFISVYLVYSFFGKTVVYPQSMEPHSILSSCRKHGVTHFFSVPLFWNNLARSINRRAERKGISEKFDSLLDMSINIQSSKGALGLVQVRENMFKDLRNEELFGDTLKMAVNGGGHILPETMRVINALGYPLSNGFGMTETGISSVNFSDKVEERLKCGVGLPFNSINYKVLDDGELYISAPSLHSGSISAGEYFPRTEEWFKTGDTAILNGGELFIQGRTKDVIINASGENIYPDELEDKFTHINEILQFCILGVNDGGVYDAITMVVRPTHTDPETLEKLFKEIDEANMTLPLFKRIDHVLISTKPLPLASGIKVKRQALKNMVETNSEEFKQFDTLMPSEKQCLTVSDNLNCDAENLEKIKQKVRTAFAGALELDESAISDEAKFVKDLGGDSLSSLSVVSRLESEYPIFVSDLEFSKVSNVNEVSQLVFYKLYGKKTDLKSNSDEVKFTKRITDFKDSDEYGELLKRFKAAKDSKLPYFVPHDSVIRDTSVINGREAINLGSYNYLGMSGHPETVKAACEAAQKYGTSASGSRVLAGEKTIYKQLEAEIALWKHTEDAIVLTGGHATNVNIVGNFCSKGDLILYDALSHNSVLQGCKLSSAESKAFPHNDISALENILKSIDGMYKKVLIVVEGVYSMDGDIAPIPEFVRLKRKYGAFLMVDEAHSSGVIGTSGGGVDEYFNLAHNDVDIKMGTLSKAIGACGGYIAADKSIIEYLKYSLPGFVFSAGISPPLAAAAKKAIELIQTDNSNVQKLHENIAYFISGAKARGLDTCLAKESAIVPVMIGSEEKAFKISSDMLECGVFVPPAVYPAVPKKQARLRFSISSAHEKEQLEKALNLLEEVLKLNG